MRAENAITPGGLSYLVVEDNPHMMEIVCAVLWSFGAKGIERATSADAAAELLKTTPFDLALLDFRLDNSDGLAIARFIRTGEHASKPSLPVIMLTAHTERSRVVAARDAGVTEFCVKPASPAEIYGKITHALNNPRRFIKAKTYVGPDRRRRNLSALPHPDRRSIRVV